MQYRTLGVSGIRVSAIGLGMAAIGRPGYITLGHGADLDGRTSLVDLERHAGHYLTFDFGSTIFANQALGERFQKASGRRAQPYTDDVYVNTLAFRILYFGRAHVRDRYSG